jgi:hypothetical protein
MKHTPQSSSPTHSKATAGIGPRPSPLTHPWWIYRANQMKLSNNHGGELLGWLSSFNLLPILRRPWNKSVSCQFS